MIFQTIYVSWAKHEFAVKELFDLLAHSRKNNQKLSVTGLLLYKDRQFFQLLEGDKQAVFAIMEKVARDPRHEGVTYLYRATASARLFPEWSMGFSRMKVLAKMGVEGLADHDMEEAMAKLDAQPNSESGRLLKTIIVQNKFCGDSQSSQSVMPS